MRIQLPMFALDVAVAPRFALFLTFANPLTHGIIVVLMGAGDIVAAPTNYIAIVFKLYRKILPSNAAAIVAQNHLLLISRITPQTSLT